MAETAGRLRGAWSVYLIIRGADVRERTRPVGVDTCPHFSLRPFQDVEGPAPQCSGMGGDCISHGVTEPVGQAGSKGHSVCLPDSGAIW